MSDTTASLRRKIGGAGDLQSVVRTMKAVAASSIGQYEKSMSTLADYYCTVGLGLGACFRASGLAPFDCRTGKTNSCWCGAVVFGSDQGLVGQFNDVVADYAVKTSAALPDGPLVRPAGERKPAAIGQGMPYLFMINWEVCLSPFLSRQGSVHRCDALFDCPERFILQYAENDAGVCVESLFLNLSQ